MGNKLKTVAAQLATVIVITAVGFFTVEYFYRSKEVWTGTVCNLTSDVSVAGEGAVYISGAGYVNSTYLLYDTFPNAKEASDKLEIGATYDIRAVENWPFVWDKKLEVDKKSPPNLERCKI